jgi:hypothetical protein
MRRSPMPVPRNQSGPEEPLSVLDVFLLVLLLLLLAYLWFSECGRAEARAAGGYPSHLPGIKAQPVWSGWRCETLQEAEKTTNATSPRRSFQWDRILTLQKG